MCVFLYVDDLNVFVQIVTKKLCYIICFGKSEIRFSYLDDFENVGINLGF